MTRKALLLASLALFLGFEVGFAQGVGNELQPDPDAANTRVGTRGGNFLEIGIGARQMAMAGAGATLMSGIHAMYWNAAAMSLAEGFGAGFTYTNLYGDLGVNYYYGGAMIPFLGGMFGINAQILTSGEIPRTTENYPDGGDPVFGNTFDWTSQSIGAFYSRAITDRLNLGAGLKFIKEGITDASASYVAFDAGVTFRTGLYGVELGAAIQNLGSDGEFKGAAVDRILDSSEQVFAPLDRDLEISFDTRKQELPTLFRFTVLWSLLGTPESLVQTGDQDHALNIALDLDDATDTDIQTAVGIEYGFRQLAFLRVGKRWFNEPQRTGAIQEQVGGDPADFRQDDFRDFGYGLSFGGGLRVPALGRTLTFDYAYIDQGELDNVQVFSFEFGF